jgi:hypothetical protein
VCHRLVAGTSRGPFQFYAPAAGTLEVRVAGKHHMAALFADEPLWPLPHRPELIAQKAIWATHHLLGHLTPPRVTDSLGLFQAILLLKNHKPRCEYRLHRGPSGLTIFLLLANLRSGLGYAAFYEISLNLELLLRA